MAGVTIVPNALGAANRVRIAGRDYPFRSIEEASRCYREAIETLGIGYSDTPPCRILDNDGQEIGWVSYNGRVWAGRSEDWPAPLVYDPSGQASVKEVV